jgi:radical SAM protein with 4Fe4S-binding SPASM domain
VFSGGDALQRDDLEDLIRHAKRRGLRAATIPAATPRLTRARVQSLKNAGLDQMALSVDAADAKRHDWFRGVEGSFALTQRGAGYARDAGLPLQINTVFSGWNWNNFDAMAELVQDWGAVFWEVFFLVPMGRATEAARPAWNHYVHLYEKIYALQQEVDFIIKVTEAQSYRAFVAERVKEEDGGQAEEEPLRDILARPVGPHGSLGQAPSAVNAGKGLVFISHVGDVFPSGFLPRAAGNVRTNDLAEIYRNAPVFRELRSPMKLKGRCGACIYRELCGGSRARAHAITGDYLAPDPDCRLSSNCPLQRAQFVDGFVHGHDILGGGHGLEIVAGGADPAAA